MATFMMIIGSVLFLLIGIAYAITRKDTPDVVRDYVEAESKSTSGSIGVNLRTGTKTQIHYCREKKDKKGKIIKKTTLLPASRYTRALLGESIILYEGEKLWTEERCLRTGQIICRVHRPDVAQRSTDRAYTGDLCFCP